MFHYDLIVAFIFGMLFGILTVFMGIVIADVFCRVLKGCSIWKLVNGHNVDYREEQIRSAQKLSDIADNISERSRAKGLNA